jgi:hypothetical protein
VYNKSIQLLKAIKEHALNYQETKYEISIMADAFRGILGTTQHENESLQDYTTRFKTAKEVLQSHVGGTLTLTKFVTTMAGYVSNDVQIIEQLSKVAEEQFFSYIYMENADQGKYESILSGLINQKSLGNDQYPRTIVETTQVFSNHKFDSGYKTKKHNDKSDKQDKRGKNYDKDKQEEKDGDASPVLSFAQLEGICYCCGKLGRKSPECHQAKMLPKNEWAINKAQQHAQAKVDDTSATTGESTISTKSPKPSKSSIKSDKHIGWASVHVERYSFAHLGDMKDWILLDSDSTDTVFCNPEYVSDIRIEEDLDVMSMLTNEHEMYCA